MATFINGFLSKDTLFPNSPATYPPKRFNLPPKFKFPYTTARNAGYKHETKSKEVNPQTHLTAITRNADYSIFIVEKQEHNIGYCISLLRHSNLEETIFSDAKQIHALVVKSGVVDSDRIIQNKLAVLYARNSSLLDDARRMFDEIPERTISVYAALIGSYCLSQQWVDVLSVFGLMVREGIQPDKFLLPRILKACSALETLSIGAMLHGFVIKKNLELDLFVGNSLIDMYAKCGDLDSSHRVFNMMAEKDVVSWTALVSAYSGAGLLDEATEIFKTMQLNSVKPDLVSWNSLISGFAQNGEIDMALQLLEEMQEKGLKPGENSWNGIISGCAQNGYFEDALDVFCDMSLFQNPNAITIASLLPACSGLKALNLGKEIHSYAIKHEIQSNIFVGGSLIDMYSKCGRSNYAERVFENMENKNTAVWNEMIAAYVNAGKMSQALELRNLMQIEGLKLDVITYNTLLVGYAREGGKNEAFDLLSEMGRMGLKPNVVSMNVLISSFQQSGHGREALKLFRAMQMPNKIFMADLKPNEAVLVEVPNMSIDSIQPNAVTITSCLSACADLNLLHQGKEIHGYVLRNCFECSVFVSSALVDMYAKCRDMVSAFKAFHRIDDKSTVSWNALMAGLAQNKESEAALKLFPKMLEDGIMPSSITFMILLSACGNIMALRLGKELHGCFAKSGFNEYTVTLASALIDMYAKCGSISEARLAFDCTVQKDLPLWNAMISGYSTHGMAKDAINLFEQLEHLGIKLDHITFTAILSACRQEGLVREGWKYFNSMESTYGIKPTLEHYTCMVGIMGGAGLLEEAEDFMRQMPYEPDACMLATLLRACRVHSNSEIGERSAKSLFELEPSNASNYIALSNIYVMAGMWDSARNVRITMRARGLKTVNVCSWIEVDNTIYAFKAGESWQPELDKILDRWDELARQMDDDGYLPHDVVFDDEGDPDPFSCFHTEKLAICFGLISLNARSPIRILKNVRMCIDCHTSAKFISKIEGRDIFVRDGCFYHHFKDGICSCRDEW